MSKEYYLLRQIKELMEVPYNRDYWCAWRDDLDLSEWLEALTAHYNGRIRERAVLCLGYMHVEAALPALIERANDWVEQVRRAARIGIEQFLRPESVNALVDCLPHFSNLLKRGRSNHQPLFDQVMQFISQPEHRDALFYALASDNREIVRTALSVILEKRLSPADFIFQQVCQHWDAPVRLKAARALLDEPARVTLHAVNIMLADSNALIKQAALHYVAESGWTPTEPQLLSLMLDTNEIVRRRAAGLLEARGGNAQEYYLSVFNDASRKAVLRAAALSGLSEQKYPGVVPLAIAALENSQAKICKVALRILCYRLQEDAREYLLAAIGHPCCSIARLAYQQFVKLKLYATSAEIEACQARELDEKQTRFYAALAARLK